MLLENSMFIAAVPLLWRVELYSSIFGTYLSIFLYFFVKSEKFSNYVLPLIFDLHMYTQSYTPLN